MNDAIYHESLLSLYRNPLNKGTPAKFHKLFRAENRSCGDHIVFYITLNKDKVKNIYWDGDGCALSIASASLFSEKIKNKKLNFIRNIKHADLTKMLNIDKLSPGREKCVDLPIECFRNK